MKNKILLMSVVLASTTLSYGQLGQFSNTLNQFFSAPEESGFMYFQTPNQYAPGQCFDYYKIAMSDTDNDMLLLSSHTDSIVGMTHYKFQQTYKGLPVEGAGCIEHFNSNGSLVFTNAKFAVDLELDVIPIIPKESAVETLIKKLPDSIEYAWDDLILEAQFKITKNDPNATYYPTPELLIAIDNFNHVHFNISASRYTLAYKITVATANPLDFKTYYLDANTGQILKIRTPHHNDIGPAGAYGYGTQNIIDTKWIGGIFHMDYHLIAEHNGRNFETRKGDNSIALAWWEDLVEHHDDDDDWGNVYLTETSAHFFTQVSWDYFQGFGRNGMDNNAAFLEVRTQFNGEGAGFDYDNNFLVPRISFGKVNGFDYCWEPSIVAHEYTHGVTEFTADLVNEFEPGALDESFSDIFGIQIQAEMLDNGSTDWIIGNQVTTLIPSRSLIDPNSDGSHFTNYNTNGAPIYALGQPDTYGGLYFYDGNDINVNDGGIHINSGVQNYWFYILSEGKSETNDLGNFYNVQGIGRDKAIQITYFALTSILQSASQFVDSRLATIQAAKEIFGECSQEHRSTIDAWYAVGLGSPNSCPLLSTEELANDLTLYPNPSNQHFVIAGYGLSQVEKVAIYDMNGKLVQEINSYQIGNTIDVSPLAQGVYQVIIQIENTISTRKLVIQ